jgi:ABC-type lipoprotein release transport system permease subunit
VKIDDTLPLLMRLSWRNLWRHRRRNGMLFAAILVAVSTVVLANSLIRGWQYQMMDIVVSNLTGHVKVLAPQYRADPSIQQAFALPGDFRPELPAEELLGWTARVRVPGVIISERDTRGVQLVGVDPSDEALMSFLAKATINGEMLSGVDDERILLGRTLAAQLKTDVGRRIVLMTQGSDGRNREAGFRVSGIFTADSTGVEKQFVFTGRSTLQAMLDTQQVTEISLRLENNEMSAAARDTLQRRFAGLEVSTWEQLEPQAAALFRFADMAIFIWFSILMLALAFGLVNTLVTAVLERIRELGMLRAIGMRPGMVIAQVVMESLLIVAAAVVCGLGLGMGFIALLADGIDLSRWSAGIEGYYIAPVLVPRIQFSDLVLVAGLSLFFGLLASVYPAWRAVQVKPLDAMRR